MINSEMIIRHTTIRVKSQLVPQTQSFVTVRDLY